MEILADLGDVALARATRDHVGTIERLLADDPTSPQHVATNTLISDDLLGAAPAECDLEAVFEQIDSDPNQDLLVILDEGNRAIGTLQLTFLRTMARGGAARAVVSGARIRAGHDSLGIAKRVFAWVVEHCRARRARADRDDGQEPRPHHRLLHHHGFPPQPRRADPDPLNAPRAASPRSVRREPAGPRPARTPTARPCPSGRSRRRGRRHVCHASCVTPIDRRGTRTT